MATAQLPAPPLPPGFASAEALLAAFVRDSGGNISFVDNEQRVRFATERFAAWLGRPLGEVLGRTLRELYGPEIHDRIDASLRRALAGETVRYEREARHAGGESHWISVVLTPTRDAAGRVIGFFSSALEVEELKRTHDALGHALEEIATHIENSPLAVIEWSSRLRVKRWSPQAESIFGWTLGEVLGKEAIEFGFIHPASIEIAQVLAEELLRAQAKRNRALVRNLTKDGRVIWCEWYNSAFFDAGGRLASILSFAEDVTARVEAEEQLQRLAVNDALTGLPNRNSLATRLEHAIRRVTRSGDRIALLFIDLDRFKKVNDSLGHAAGDEVLRQVGARIRACVREVDSVARLGGDEFVVLLETDVRPDTPGIIGERVRAAFATPFDWKGTEVHCGASIGVSLYPDHARDPAALLASADAAMYRVKREPQT
jgi:diguanylate cyclase (GGDEF)-like protein/PAS domain S-box-containing protein